MAERSDSELLAQFLRGDEDAFAVLVERHQGRVYAVCMRYFGNHADAQDATQEAFLVVYRRAETFEGSAQFSTWLYRVAVNVCNDLARRRARRPQTEGSDLLALAGSGHDQIGQLELGLLLREALAGLSPEYREAVVLHSVYGVPYADIARRAGVAVGTAKSRVHRGHALLAAALTRMEREEPSRRAPTPSGEPMTSE